MGNSDKRSQAINDVLKGIMADKALVKVAKKHEEERECPYIQYATMRYTRNCRFRGLNIYPTGEHQILYTTNFETFGPDGPEWWDVLCESPLFIEEGEVMYLYTIYEGLRNHRSIFGSARNIGARRSHRRVLQASDLILDAGYSPKKLKQSLEKCVR